MHYLAAIAVRVHSRLPRGKHGGMSRRRNLHACAVGMVALALPWGASLAQGGAEQLATLFPLLNNAIERATPVSPEQAKHLRDFQSELQRFETNLSRTDGSADLSPVVRAYRQELQGIAERPVSEESKTALAYLRNDVQLKNSFVRDTAGLVAFGKRLSVRVRVTTLAGANPVGGYSVAVNPRRDSDKALAMLKFPSDTNDAVHDLMPGHYRLMLFKGEQRVHSRDVPIGQSRQPEEEIRIDVSTFSSTPR